MSNQLNEAVSNFDQGKFEDAAKICERILTGEPDNIGALNILGGSLARLGRIRQAISAAERVCALEPGNAAFYGNLSYLHSLAGNAPKAVLFMAHAVASDPANKACQVNFARLIDHMEFYALAPETTVIKEAIRICLVNPGLDTEPLSTAWHSLLLLDPVFTRLAENTRKGDYEEQQKAVDPEALTNPLAEPFLLLGLRSLHATDERLERILTFFRRYFTTQMDVPDAKKFLPFISALAEHCILNEYIYNCTNEEQERVDALEAGIDALPGSDADTRARLALIRCYRSSPQQYADAISTLPASQGPGKNTVSSTVARQYEENPYPRWRHIDIPALSEKLIAKGRERKILVAGCGTGYELLNLAVHYPQARVLGVDLSMASLAYARHKAVEFGIENVEFMQADILDLGDLGQQFDLVSCMGVLHHMEDPLEGWRKLNACLEPDGLMRIALYSEAARQIVTSCRNWIEERGFEATPQGIRAFRQEIMELDPGDPLREVMKWTDFWSMSMCRDLVFHVQEHQLTIPWIQSALDELRLRFLSMRISNPFFKKEYRSLHPDDPSISNLYYLHAFEMKNPMTFRDMYQFWCCREGSATAERPPAWFYTFSRT